MKPLAALHEIGRHTERIRPVLSETLSALDTWSGLGYPTGGGNGRTSETSNPTARIASAVVDAERAWDGKDPFVRDSFARDRAQLADELNTAEAALRRARDIVDRSQALPPGVIAAAEGCEPCGRVTKGSKPHEASYQPIHTRIERHDNPDGPKLPLCKFHYDWTLRYEELPAVAIDVWHLEHLGSRVPNQMVRDHMPEAFDRAQAKASGRPLAVSRLELRVESR